MSKIALAPNASGTGTLTISAPNTNSNYTLTLPTQTGNILTSATTTGFPAGSVLQVVQGTYSTFTSTNSSAFSDTGVTATITPSSASSKILVCITLSLGKVTNNTYAKLKLVKNGVDLISLSDAFASTGTTLWIDAAYAANYLDSPASTSALTYKVQYASGANNSAVQLNNYVNTAGNSLSTITLMEIAA